MRLFKLKPIRPPTPGSDVSNSVSRSVVKCMPTSIFGTSDCASVICSLPRSRDAERNAAKAVCFKNIYCFVVFCVCDSPIVLHRECKDYRKQLHLKGPTDCKGNRGIYGPSKVPAL